jgi:hypothetical protein
MRVGKDVLKFFSGISPLRINRGGSGDMPGVKPRVLSRYTQGKKPETLEKHHGSGVELTRFYRRHNLAWGTKSGEKQTLLNVWSISSGKIRKEPERLIAGRNIPAISPQP